MGSGLPPPSPTRPATVAHASGHRRIYQKSGSMTRAMLARQARQHIRPVPRVPRALPGHNRPSRAHHPLTDDALQKQRRTAELEQHFGAAQTIEQVQAAIAPHADHERPYRKQIGRQKIPDGAETTFRQAARTLHDGMPYRDATAPRQKRTPQINLNYTSDPPGINTPARGWHSGGSKTPHTFPRGSSVRSTVRFSPGSPEADGTSRAPAVRLGQQASRPRRTAQNLPPGPIGQSLAATSRHTPRYRMKRLRSSSWMMLSRCRRT